MGERGNRSSVLKKNWNFSTFFNTLKKLLNSRKLFSTLKKLL